MKISKEDFVEIEFVGRVKDGNIFDTNKEEIIKKEQLNIQVKPLVVCIGHSMVVSGFDRALEDKEIGEEYIIELPPQEAFGERNPSLVKIMPLRIFHQHNIDPKPGMSFVMDNYLVRISAVSGGRVTADFNNPLSGKKIIYDFSVKRKLESPEEKIKALMQFFFNAEIPFTLEKEKVIFYLDKNKPEEANQALMIETMREKFKEMLKLEVEVKPKINEEKDRKKEPEKSVIDHNRDHNHDHEEHDHTH